MGSPGSENGAFAHPTEDERASRGKAARGDVPRRVHGDWSPPPARADPVAVLHEQDKTRVAELVPIRYGRMLVSPLTFFRGAAAIMAADLADGPRTGLQAQLCGDAHLSNFGIFAAPDRRLTFNVNDFDETLPGPFEWDLKRLVASFAVAGRERGFGRKARARISSAVARSYREAMRDFASMRTLDLWYARIEVDELARSFMEQASSREAKRLERDLAKARTKDSPVEELPDAGRPEIARETIERVIREYRRTLSGDRRRLVERFRYVAAAHKVVGVGSVGTSAWIVLMLGRDVDDPLFLQAKEAGASVLEPYLGKSAYSNHGQRVVEGQRLIQSGSDILLGWIREEDAAQPDGLRASVRLDAGQGTRPLGRPDRHRRLPRQERRLRSSARIVCGGLRGPERARPRSAQGCRRGGPCQSRDRRLSRRRAGNHRSRWSSGRRPGTPSNSGRVLTSTTPSASGGGCSPKLWARSSSCSSPLALPWSTRRATARSAAALPSRRRA